MTTKNKTAQHTPGPWTLNGGQIVGPDNAPVMTVPREYMRKLRPHQIVQANIDLVASAPDLLAACEALLEWSTHVWDECHPSGDPPSLNAARAAIAKARGK
jgi:hypothetical protein